MIDNSATIIRDWKRARDGDYSVCENFVADIQIKEHIDRYAWAIENIRKRGPTLDIPCGSGFGTAMLSEKTMTFGMDIDPTKIDICRESYPYGLYLKGDMLNSTFSDNRFANIVSIEGIEHVEDTDGYLIEMKRLLEDDGRFVCSTANRLMHGMGHPISCHIYAWDKEEFEAVLKVHFKILKMESIDSGRGITSWIALCTK